MSGNLRVAELDFDSIKANLSNFLKGQTYFTDYDFDGSAMSILTDLLAYDTHYKAYLANMVINERFIDTAIKRGSVVSHAKTLGYVPRSYTSARAVVDISVYGVSESYTMNIERFTQFTTSVNGKSYTFVNTQSYSAIPSGEYANYTFPNVELYEGTPVTYKYTVPDSTANQLFKIPALNADTSTMQVIVQQSASNTQSSVYEYADSVSLLGSNDLVYFLEEGTDGYYYIYFGDGILGKAIAAGNVIKMSYLTTNGSDANTSSMYSQIFSLNGSIGGYGDSNVVISLVSASVGGDEKQSVDEIKFIAPKNYSASGRAVSTDDYKALLIKNFAEIDSIECWGGEENYPPIYGKVFISIKPTYGYTLSSSTKVKILAFLKKNGIVTIQHEFVDPDFTYVSVGSTVRYDPNLTTKDAATIEANISSLISTFFSLSLQQFSKNLYISKLQTVIDLADPSIQGNHITLGLQKRVDPVIGLNSSYTLYYNNAVSPYSISSSAFNIMTADGTIVTVAVKDVPDTNPPTATGTGTLQLYNITTSAVVRPNAGTVNYGTGVINILSITLISYPSTSLYDIRFNCKPQAQIEELSTSILLPGSVSATMPTAMKNQILMLDDSTAVPSYLLDNGVAVSALTV